MYVEYNPNPTGRRVGDCAVRAVAKALGIDWETAYLMIATNGYYMGDMPSSNSVWGSVLRKMGFYRKALPDNCPDCSYRGSYDDYSGRRDSMGRYARESRDYSRDEGMIHKLYDIMDKSPDQATRMDIQKLIQKMSEMN